MLCTAIRPAAHVRPVCTFSRRCASSSAHAPRPSGRTALSVLSIMRFRASSSSVKPLAITVAAIGSTAFVKKPVLCQHAYTVPGGPAPTATSGGGLFDGGTRRPTDEQVSKKLFHTGEISFGVVLGFCSGYLIKKVGKLFALAVGAGFIFLQYMSFKGFITVHWDRLEGGYQGHLDVDKDGKVTHRDIRSHWDRFVGLLTHNVQFKSTFLVGLYTGIRYG